MLVNDSKAVVGRSPKEQKRVQSVIHKTKNGICTSLWATHSSTATQGGTPSETAYQNASFLEESCLNSRRVLTQTCCCTPSNLAQDLGSLGSPNRNSSDQALWIAHLGVSRFLRLPAKPMETRHETRPGRHGGTPRLWPASDCISAVCSCLGQ